MPISLLPAPLRKTPASVLGILKPPVAKAVDASAVTDPRSTIPLPLSVDNAVLKRTKDLIEDGFAGVILSGPPGTSKSWYARRLAFSLVDNDEERVRFVQFHPSYQYEDFIESYEPTDSGGFKPKARTFLTLCEQATVSPNLMFVLVIDELSRCDAVRVFGEALTYLEKSQRNVEFELASGRRVQIPSNIFIVATMNPWDRGVDDLDMAFERRFAKIAMDPDADILQTMLRENGLPDVQIQRLLAFFRRVQQHRNQFARIGHAYFSRVGSTDALKRLWDCQLRFHFEKAFRQNPQEFAQISDAWSGIFREVPTAVDAGAPVQPTQAVEQAIEFAQQSAVTDGAVAPQ